ncbi:coactosin-like protein [Macrosteles quadrilineatus]|uniref:coactosin-like protein n=1 Tax=Macrosteles quadrilineatus TaxID=74068 RepID=UPI0023E2C424|nr:coactosin-like protein [Macrosteles quadrilineatus]
MADEGIEYDMVIKQEGPKKVDLSTQIDSEAIQKAYNEVRDDTSETNWLVLKYNGERIVCSGKGTSFERFKDEFGENDRAYGYIRVQMGDEMSKRQKFLLLTWVGEDVGVIKRAKMSTDKALVKNILSNFAVELQLENKSEFDINFFKDQLNKAGGANYGTGVRDL